MDADKTLTVILDLGSELVRGGTEVWLVEERLAEICDAYGFKTHDILIVSDYIKATVQTYSGAVRISAKAAAFGGDKSGMEGAGRFICEPA